MYTKGRKKGTIRFKVRAGAGTGKAAVAGDFSNWKPVSMRRQRDGSFAATVLVPPGRHEYKFILDGDWAHDTDVPEVAMNCHGTFNSVAVME